MWASRPLSVITAPGFVILRFPEGDNAMNEVTVTSTVNLRNEVRYNKDKTLITDEPIAAGGEDAGPDPYTLLLAALGSCISMTAQLYAKRKGWPLERITVRLRQQRIHSKDCQECVQNK